jgi:hypothetical protein
MAAMIDLNSGSGFVYGALSAVCDAGVRINALKRHDAAITVWVDGIAASIASMIAMAGDEVVMPENAMLMLHDPSGLVMGTAADMRGMAEALDRMKAGMVAAYRDKSGRDDAEIEALMQAETWLSAHEAVALGLADRIEQPVKMAAHFDLSRFRNPPPQLAATLSSSTPQEDGMSDSQKTRSRKPDAAEATAAGAAATEASHEQIGSAEDDRPAEAAEPTLTPAAAADSPQTRAGTPGAAAAAHQQTTATALAAAAQPTAQVIDLEAVRVDERKATLAYVAEVHELCAIAGRGDLAVGFIGKATPIAQVRRALLEARAAEDEATAIRSQVRPASVEPAQPAIDTAAIYTARNQHCR